MQWGNSPSKTQRQLWKPSRLRVCWVGLEIPFRLTPRLISQQAGEVKVKLERHQLI